MSATLLRSEIGTVDYAPGTLLLNTTDNLGTITSSGYLNKIAAASSVQIRPTDFIFANYNGGNALFVLTVSAGVYTLAVASGGTITGGTSLGGDAIYAGVSGSDLTFKGLTAGSNITLTPSGTDITIASSGGGGGFAYQNALWVSQANGNDSNLGTSIDTPLLTVQAAITLASTTPTIIYVVDENSANFENINTLGTGQVLCIVAPGTSFASSITQNGTDSVTYYGGSCFTYNNSSTGQFTSNCSLIFLRASAANQNFVTCQNFSCNLSGSATVNVNCAFYNGGSNDGTGYLNGCLGGNLSGLSGNSIIGGSLTIGTSIVTPGQFYTLPTADGTAGQVPQTDGAGTVTWQNGGSGSNFAWQGVYWVAQQDGSDSNVGTDINEPFLTLQHALNGVASSNYTINMLDYGHNSETLSTLGDGGAILVNAPNTIFSSGTLTSYDDITFNCQSWNYVTIATNNGTNLSINSEYATGTFVGTGGITINSRVVTSPIITGASNFYVNCESLVGTMALTSGATVYVNCLDSTGLTITNDGSCYVNGILGATKIYYPGAYVPTIYTNTFWYAEIGSDLNSGTSIETPFQTAQKAVTQASVTPTLIYAVDANTSGGNGFTTLGTGQILYLDAPGQSLGNIEVAAGDTVTIDCDSIFSLTVDAGAFCYVRTRNINNLINNGGISLVSDVCENVTAVSATDTAIVSNQLTGEVDITGGNAEISCQILSGILALATSATVLFSAQAVTGTITNDASCLLNGVLGGILPGLSGGQSIGGDLTFGNGTQINYTQTSAAPTGANQVLLSSGAGPSATTSWGSALTGAILHNAGGLQTIIGGAFSVTQGNFTVGSSGTAGTIVIDDSTGSHHMTLSVGAPLATNIVIEPDTAASWLNGTTFFLPDSGNGGISRFIINQGINQMDNASQFLFDKGTGAEVAGAVTINEQSGIISTSALTTVGGSSYVITLTNSTITTGSAILITSNGGTNTTTDYVVEATPNTGFATITIYNNSVLALNGTMTLSFLVF